MSKIGIVGAGAWGTTLAILFAKNNEVTLWAKEAEVVSGINQKHENALFLSGINTPSQLKATNDPKDLDHSDIVIFVVPSKFFRSTTMYFKGLNPKTILISATKGLESQSHKRMSEILGEEFPKNPLAVLSGPNLSKEIAQGLPAAAVIASKELKLAEELQQTLSQDKYRLYSSVDVAGVEIGGALKNVIALAAGIVDGLKLGANAKAALLIRGITEITRLAVALGANKETLLGLSGMGDLIATCESSLSRNHQVGVRLAKGEKIDVITKSMKDVAEGVSTCLPALELAQSKGIELPITEKISEVLYSNLDPKTAIAALMSRSLKRE
jgi:glycerol-3-phosphate dehydrogenase (NAD(P)+)